MCGYVVNNVSSRGVWGTGKLSSAKVAYVEVAVWGSLSASAETVCEDSELAVWSSVTSV